MDKTLQTFLTKQLNVEDAAGFLIKVMPRGDGDVVFRVYTEEEPKNFLQFKVLNNLLLPLN